MEGVFTSFRSNELSCEADNPPAEEVLARIEVIVKCFLRNLMAPDPSISPLVLPCRTAKNSLVRAQGCIGKDLSIFLSRATFKRTFESKTGTKGFLRVWKVLEVSYKLLQLGKRATQREIYYTLLSDSPCLFRVQSQVDDAVQDAAALLQCSRHSLGIIASSKGTLVGRLRIQEPNGQVIDCTKLGSNGHAINGDISYLEKLEYQSDAHYILVVEKDTIFHRLAEDRFFMLVPSIIITGKGYPDLATRVVLHRLHISFPQMPVFALVDWNPAGLAIICTYKFGSIRMGRETPNHVCNVKWLGLRSDDLQHVPRRSLLNLKKRDESIAKGLLLSKMLQNHASYRDELSKMLECGKRFEIEALYAHGYPFLSSIISKKIVERDYI